MNEEISELQADLRDKFEALCLMHDQPALFISEYFSNNRYKIDIDAETALESLKKKEKPPGKESYIRPYDENTRNKLSIAINQQRTKFIDFLNQIEQKLLTKLDSRPKAESSQVYADMKQQIDQFTVTPCQDAGLSDFEDQYVRIAWQIIEETLKLEKQLLDNQTSFYIPSRAEKKLGNLLHMPDVCLNSEELKFLVIPPKVKIDLIWPFVCSKSSELLDGDYFKVNRKPHALSSLIQVQTTIFNISQLERSGTFIVK